VIAKDEADCGKIGGEKVENCESCSLPRKDK